MALPENWVNNVGMQVDADYLNQVGEEVNANTAALAALTGTQSAFVATAESTSSTSYTTLTTTTDSVTLNVPESGKVLIYVSAQMYISNGPATCLVGVALSGANSASASDTKAMLHLPAANGAAWEQHHGALLDFSGLNEGETIFGMRYRVGAHTGTFKNRLIIGLPLP